MGAEFNEINIKILIIFYCYCINLAGHNLIKIIYQILIMLVKLLRFAVIFISLFSSIITIM